MENLSVSSPQSSGKDQVGPRKKVLDLTYNNVTKQLCDRIVRLLENQKLEKAAQLLP